MTASVHTMELVINKWLNYISDSILKTNRLQPNLVMECRGKSSLEVAPTTSGRPRIFD